jgi:hypothetical protein
MLERPIRHVPHAAETAHDRLRTEPFARNTSFRVESPLARRFQPRFHGPGADVAFALRRLPSRLLAAEALPRPDRLGHHLSRARDDPGWRGQRRRRDAMCMRPLRTHQGGPACARPTKRPAHAGPLRPRHGFRRRRCARAASHDLPRRRPRSAAPEVPFIDGLPILERAFGPLSTRGWVAIHRLSPTCGLPTGAFSFLVGSTAF